MLRLLVLCLVYFPQKAATFWVDIVFTTMFILLYVVRSTLDLQGLKKSDILEMSGDIKL